MNKNIQKNLTIILLLVIVIGLSIYIVKDYISNKDKIKLEKPIVDTFIYDFRDGYD
jgi:nitrogen fixation/metabolism regulation signal transduction histidine kinase